MRSFIEEILVICFVLPCSILIAYKSGFFEAIKPALVLFVELTKVILISLIDLLKNGFQMSSPKSLYDNIL
jgi:hypothetical protein